MAITSNVDRVDSWLQAAIKGVNFEMPGPISTLGHDMTVAAAEGIRERAEQQQAGKTQAWRENNPEYKKWKETHYGTGLTNFRTFQMLSLMSLLGVQKIVDEGKTLEWLYGVDEPPSWSKSGYLNEEDEAVTDRQKASIAEADDRKFFELDEDINSQRILPVLKEALAKYLQEKANG